MFSRQVKCSRDINNKNYFYSDFAFIQYEFMYLIILNSPSESLHRFY